MASEWTQMERLSASKQVMDDVGTGGYGNLAHEYCCQRNRLLAFARRVALQYAGTDAPLGQEANAAIAACEKGDA
jgi:hypothetical protein